MIDHIIDGVHISDAASVISSSQREKLQRLKIQRVLTVSAMSIDSAGKLPEIQYKFLFMMDMPTQDLLGDNLIEEAIAFIEKAVADKANIVVHCELGMSRSVAVVCAYLMKRFEWSATKALLFIKDKRPNAEPNPSFMLQLEIFAQLNYHADSRSLAVSPLYRNFCADSGNLPKLANDDPSTSESRGNRTASLDKKSPAALAARCRFRCKKCRSDLFYDTHILCHARGASGTTGKPLISQLKHAHEQGDGLTGEDLSRRCGFEYFITPMKWMEAEHFQGKINCYKCGEKLGQYDWGGKKCGGTEHGSNCGTHVSPWFHIQKSKVDETRIQPMNGTVSYAVPKVVFTGV